MKTTVFQQAKILQRNHKTVWLISIGIAVVLFFGAQYLMMSERNLTSAQDWWLTDAMDAAALLVMARSYLRGILYNNKIGTLRFERHPAGRSLTIEDERFHGQWLIWREGASLGDGLTSPVFLIFGVIILVLALMTWVKTFHFHGSFQLWQRRGAIQSFLIGLAFLFVGIRSWINRVYTYRLYVRQGRMMMILGIKVPPVNLQ